MWSSERNVRLRYMDATEVWDERGPRIEDFRNLSSRQREQYVHIDHSIEGCDKRIGSYKAPSTIHELTECFVDFNTICGVYYRSTMPYFNSLGFSQLIKLNYEDDEKYDLRELCDFVDCQWQHWCVQLDRLTREPNRFQSSDSQ